MYANLQGVCLWGSQAESWKCNQASVQPDLRQMSNWRKASAYPLYCVPACCCDSPTLFFVIYVSSSKKVCCSALWCVHEDNHMGSILAAEGVDIQIIALFSLSEIIPSFLIFGARNNSSSLSAKSNMCWLFQKKRDFLPESKMQNPRT